MLIISYQHELITTVRKCITNNLVNSGDRAYDQQEHRKFNHTVRTMIRILFAFSIVVSVSFSAPNPIARKAIGLPPHFLAGRPIVSDIIYGLVQFSVAQVIQHRFASIVTSIGTLLLGMRFKLRLLVHRYDRILIQPAANDEVLFSNIVSEIREALKIHLEYWRCFVLYLDCVAILIVNNTFQIFWPFEEISWNVICFDSLLFNFQHRISVVCR